MLPKLSNWASGRAFANARCLRELGNEFYVSHLAGDPPVASLIRRSVSRVRWHPSASCCCRGSIKSCCCLRPRMDRPSSGAWMCCRNAYMFTIRWRVGEQKACVRGQRSGGMLSVNAPLSPTGVRGSLLQMFCQALAQKCPR